MHYEMLSRALAYASCLSTTCLFATSVALAAPHVGLVKPPQCGPMVCAEMASKPSPRTAASPEKVQMKKVAADYSSKKI